ncbi:Uncharacterised protein [Corynebacterium kutscheri]|uniref:CGL2689-like C-terminal domain-containing protein n=1 Tax=Corynebacterium kutscheri TaxID=35755 RepID=A0A0F6TCJ3_9CORY|nr:hypothetical protein [Corynebacterium kutscheri]AKE40744.1 hypothetical protein UL82_02595 [Corynebacterium kutscheri]VEH04588.1 Uncharacterised protein [Corynebacterium kutscheri]VEH11142.1 Uncharacterised protein [Corynebacterium kutscheri]VEH80381.1 Uncharacterised protein [Corynebacterium kutscheri]
MTIATFGYNEFADKLESAGHTVIRVSDPREIAACEMVIVDEDAAVCAAFARPGQIFVHTGFHRDLALFAPLVAQGAIGFITLPITPLKRTVTATDEVAAMVAELLINEVNAQAIPVKNEALAQLVAGVAYASFLNAISFEATSLLEQAVDNYDFVFDIRAGAQLSHELMDVTTMQEAVEQIEHRPSKRTFKELARRMAERTRAHDVEWWAIDEGE